MSELFIPTLSFWENGNSWYGSWGQARFYIHPEIPEDLLPLSAGLCVREGLPWQTAMEAITCVPAEQAGIADRVGSLVPGLDADVVLFAGDPLSLEARPALVMINGKIVHKNFIK